MNKNKLHIQRILEVTILLVLFFQSFLSLMSPVVEADPDTIYVPGDHPTIQDAIDNATAGDTIYVNSGTYNETLNINKQLTIEGEDKTTTFINGMNNWDIIEINADGVEIFGFTIFNSSDDGIDIDNVNGTIIHDCIIYNCSDYGIYVRESDFTTIENCTINDIEAGIYLSISHEAFIAGCNISRTGESWDSEGIRLYNSHQVVISDCNLSFCGSHGISVEASRYTEILSCDIYNITNDGISSDDSDHLLVQDCNIFNCSSEGVSIGYSDHARIIGCDIHDIKYEGIDCRGSDDILIAGNDVYNCSEWYAGINLDRCDRALITNCSSYNQWYGITLRGTDNVKIKDCFTYDTYYGFYLESSDVTTIGNCTIYDNDYGIYSDASLKTYVARSNIYNNSYDGFHLAESSGVVVCSNFTYNNDGIDGYKSILRARYNRFEGNYDEGVYCGSRSIFNATENWWGNETGPYHWSLNPTGTGDAVTEYVEFDPWQTTLNQPDELLSDLRCKIIQASTNSTYYVPTGNIYDDSAFYAYKGDNQIITPPTQSPESNDYLNGDGSPKFDGDIVTFGGRFANRLVAYYEDAGLAKIGFANNGTHHIFRRISDGAHVYAVESSTYNADEKDYLVFQFFRDGDRYVLSEWGIGARGTYAGGLCYIDVILPNVGSFTNSYFIFSWTDVNGDLKPQPEEIAIEASGN